MPKNISIILYKPQNPGNIGATARVMSNFGFNGLYLVDPETDHLSRESLDRATHSKEILKKARIISKDDLQKFAYLIATTSKLGTDYNINRSPISPEKLAELLKDKHGEIGIVFGPEDKGLSNEEIKRCDFVVSIPTYKRCSTMNLSHSVTVLLYELFKKTNKQKIGIIKQASKNTKDTLLKLIFNKLEDIEFSTKEKRETQKIIWKRLIGKSFLTEREAFALFGFFKKI